MVETGLEDNIILIKLLECSTNILELDLSKNTKLNLLFDSKSQDLVVEKVSQGERKKQRRDLEEAKQKQPPAATAAATVIKKVADFKGLVPVSFVDHPAFQSNLASVYEP